MGTKKFKIYKVCVCFVITTALITLYKYDPGVTEHNLYPSSFFRELTGFYCPGCGATRALHQILHGNLKAALALNPLIVIFLPYFIYLFFNAYLLDNRKIIDQNLNNKNLSICAIIFLMYGIIRNISIYPFSLLAPH